MRVGTTTSTAGRRDDRPGVTWALRAAVAGALVLTAVAFVAIRHLGHTFSPGSMALGRLVVASLVLGAAFLAARSWRPMSRREWGVVAALGVVLFGVYSVALHAGERLVDAGTTALVTQVGPAAIALLAVPLLGERITARALLGLAVAFAGVVTISLGASSGLTGSLVGVALCLVAAIAYAFGAVLEKPLVARLPALQVTWVACTIGAVACLPFAGGLWREGLAASTVDLVWLVLLGVGPTAVAFTGFAFALRHMDASALGVTLYLIPPLTVLLSWAVLAETPSGAAYVGGALALVGVAVARRDPHRAASTGSSQP